MDAAEPPDHSDLDAITPLAGDGPTESHEPTEPDPAPAARGVRRKPALLAAGAVVAIAAGAAFGVHNASGSKAAASANPIVTNAAGGTNGANTQTFGGGTGGPGANGSFRPGAFGTISAINGSTLTVKATDGTTTKVATTTKTAVTKSTTASVASIAVGDHLTVIGSGSSTKIAAQRITDSGTVASTGGAGGLGGPGGATSQRGTGNPPSGGGFNGAPPSNGSGNSTARSFTAQTGTVKSISGSTITLTTTAGKTVTVTTASTTTVTRTAKSTVAALAVGDQVMVTGSTANGTLTATSIREGDVGGFGGFGAGPGTGNGGPTTPTTTTGTTS